MTWLLHALGLDTQQSMPYDFWSGIATQGSMAAVIAGAYRRHACHHRRCRRLGRHVVDGSPWCDRHHQEAREGQ